MSSVFQAWKESQEIHLSSSIAHSLVIFFACYLKLSASSVPTYPRAVRRTIPWANKNILLTAFPFRWNERSYFHFVIRILSVSHLKTESVKQSFYILHITHVGFKCTTTTAIKAFINALHLPSPNNDEYVKLVILSFSIIFPFLRRWLKM